MGHYGQIVDNFVERTLHYTDYSLQYIIFAIHTVGVIRWLDTRYLFPVCDTHVAIISSSWKSSARLAPMWQQSGTLLFGSCHGIAGFLVDELQI